MVKSVIIMPQTAIVMAKSVIIMPQTAIVMAITTIVMAKTIIIMSQRVINRQLLPSINADFLPIPAYTLRILYLKKQYHVLYN